MQSVNNENSEITGSQNATRRQIARLAALTLIFSYAELLIPRVLPFFRLGLGNAALLMGLAAGLTFPTFMLLSVVKAVAANLMAGTLFSPFFLVSFAQSLVSALIMFWLYRAGLPGLHRPCVSRENSRVSRKIGGRRLLSLYGISVCGAAASALVQISLTAFYLGQGTWSLLGPMLLFNLISGFVTAWLAEFLGNANEGGEVIYSNKSEKIVHRTIFSDLHDNKSLAPKTVVSTGSTTVFSTTPSSGGHPRNAPGDISGSHPVPRFRNILCLALFLAVAASVFFIKNTAVLCGILVLSFLAQKISGRKILLLPHLSLWLFILLTSVFVPNGRVLLTVAGFSITEGAALSGLQKALRLSIVSALSQTAATIRLSAAPDTLLALTLGYYSQMLDTFRNTPGSLITKIRSALG